MRNIAQSLGPAFKDYITELTTLITGTLLHDTTSSQIRKEAAKCLSVMLNCLSDSEEMKKYINVVIGPVGNEIMLRLEKLDFGTVKYLMKEL